MPFLTGRRRRNRAAARGRRRHLQSEMLESRCLLTAVTMTNQEQLLLELVNHARANPAAEAFRYGIDLNQDLDPDTISAESKQPLSPHQALIDAAGAHAQDMLDYDYFEHVNLRGEGPADRARAAGYPAGAGENIAWYGAGPRLDKTGEVYARHEALFLSPPHRKNMMTPGYRELGTGIRYGEYEGLYSIMVAEEFGNRGGEFFVTGVAYTDDVVLDNFYSVGEGLGSITVTATRHRDGQTFTTTTGPSGGYGLQVPAGVYRVTASGPRVTSPVTVQDVAILSSNQKVDFNTRVSGLGSVSGQVFDDRDRDGTRDAGEGPLAGQTIYLDSDDNGEPSPDETSTESDASGNFRWDGLRSGTYQVRVEAAPGWQASAPSSGLYSGALSPGQSVTGLLFGAYLVNASPVARPDQFQTEQGQSLTVDVFANDSDADGTMMPETTRIVVAPQHGDVRLDRGSAKLVFFPVAGYVGSDFFDYTVDDDGGLTSNVARVQLQINPGPGLAWQNPANKHDVNADTFMSSIDALLILNDINAQGTRRLTVPQPGLQPPPYIDVSGDGFTTSLDALLVLNELNRIFTRPRNAQKAEGEAEGEDEGKGKISLEPFVTAGLVASDPPDPQDPNDLARFREGEAPAKPRGVPGNTARREPRPPDTVPRITQSQLATAADKWPAVTAAARQAAVVSAELALVPPQAVVAIRDSSAPLTPPITHLLAAAAVDLLLQADLCGEL